MAKKKLLKKSKQVKNSNSKYLGSENSSLTISLIILAIIGLGYLVFSPALEAGFVNWDDNLNVYENEWVKSINSEYFWSNVRGIFSTTVIGNYNPLSILSLAGDKMMFGLENLEPWHRHNIILHLLNTILVFFIGRKLGLSLVASSFLSLLFGVHPMRVESVAWITERKDVLFGFYYLLCILMYIHLRSGDIKKKSNKRLLLVGIYVSFIISLLSKIQAVSLPMSLICIDYFFDRKISFRNVFSKWPFFLLSIIVGLAGAYFMAIRPIETNAVYTGFVRVFFSANTMIEYLIKSIIPYRMSAIYPYPTTIPWYIYASIIPFLGFLWYLWHSYKKGYRIIFFGALFFFVNVVFLLQFQPAGQGFRADRYTYIPYLGLFFILSYYFDKYFSKTGLMKISSMALAVTLVFIYSVQSYNQTKIWNNSGSLWSHVLKFYPNTALAHKNRASHFRDIGQNQLALNDYNQVLRLIPNDPEAFNSRARIYFLDNKGNSLSLALRDFSNAIELDPKNGEYRINRGAVYARTGMIDLAKADFDEGISLNPGFANGWLNRCIFHEQTGKLDLAVKDIQEYLRLVPGDAKNWYRAGNIFSKINQLNKAISAFNMAIQYEPRVAASYYERSKCYYNLGQIDEAKQDFTKAEQLGMQTDPRYRLSLFSQK